MKKSKYSSIESIISASKKADIPRKRNKKKTYLTNSYYNNAIPILYCIVWSRRLSENKFTVQPETHTLNLVKHTHQYI